MVDHGVCIPAFRIIAIQVAEFCDYYLHASGATRLNVAPVVAHIYAIFGRDTHALARSKQGRWMRFRMRRRVATDYARRPFMYAKESEQGMREALRFVGDNDIGLMLLGFRVQRAISPSLNCP